MELDVKLEEVPIEKVCRTCLTTSEESMVSLYDEYSAEKLNYFAMLKETFGKIVPSDVPNLPIKLCSTCRDLIIASYAFKTKCMKNTRLLIGTLQDEDLFELSNLDKFTQTDDFQDTSDIHFEDENFDSLILKEDAIFSANEDTNPMILQATSPVSVKIELGGKASNIDEIQPENEENLNENEVETLSEEFVCDVNPFTQNDEDANVSAKIMHECDKCGRNFARATHLKRHLMTHEEFKPIKCTSCEKRFTRVDHLNHHVLSHHSESKPFHCEVPDCRKGFLKEELLKKHTEAKHSENSKLKEICSICQKSFSAKKYLRSHMKTHNNCEKNAAKKDPQNEKPYLCSECGLRFVRNDYLVIHMRRHLGLKPYKCRFCDKGFPRATDLTVHERYHTNEKTHLCNLCGKGFQRAYNLLVHMRVHTGEKPYRCSYCSKSFSQGNDLKAHIRRHTGERFKCDLCSEGFIQGYHLTHHKRTVHGLDVKSHIRRVEKFVAPSGDDNNKQEATMFSNNSDEMKVENEYQFSGS